MIIIALIYLDRGIAIIEKAKADALVKYSGLQAEQT